MCALPIGTGHHDDGQNKMHQWQKATLPKADSLSIPSNEASSKPGWIKPQALCVMVHLKEVHNQPWGVHKM